MGREQIKLTFVGDVMCEADQIIEHKIGEDEFDFNGVFSDCAEYFSNSDYVVANLETPIAGKECGYSDRKWSFNSPIEFAMALKNAGIDLVSTANNHCLDRGVKGLINTIRSLDKCNLKHIGTYADKDSKSCFIEDIHGIKIAFLSYTYGTNGIPIPKEHSYLVNLIDMEKMKADIRKAKGLSPDFIVVSIHFGEEYQEYPNGNQKQIVDELFDVGADIILGSHPHVIQSMETRKITRDDGSEKICFVIYSLGNFVSSQRTPLYPPRDAGIILNLDFEKIENEKAELKSVSFMPTWVQFSKKDGKRLIRVIGNNLSEEELKEELNGDEINRFKSTREYILQHLLGENEIRIKDDFYVYPF